MSRGWVARPIDAKWRRIRLFVLQRDGYTCQIKGPKCTTTATVVDHKWGRGVSDDPGDCRAACVECNARYRPPTDPPPAPRTRW